MSIDDQSSDHPNDEPKSGEASEPWPKIDMSVTADAASLPTEASNPRVPKNWPNIDGYLVKEYLGGGGFGDVFRAHSIKLGGPVAIKILKPRFSLEKSITKRFQTEVQAAAKTRHTHVVQVLDTGVSVEPPYQDCSYLVTEYLSGGDFSSWLRDHSLNEPRTLTAAIRILIGVCRGLEVIHRNGIIHRDLKPDNILLDDEGFAKVGDFGLSVIDEEDALRVTGTGQILGTLPYMSPEQILGAKNVVPASDQYAIGVMLYLILWKRRPWQQGAQDEEERSRILMNLDSTPPPPSVQKPPQARLQQICFRCLQPLPEQRYPNVTELRLALEGWLHNEAAPPPTHKRPKLALASVLSVLLMGMGYGLFASLRNPSSSDTNNVSEQASEPLPATSSTSQLNSAAQTPKPSWPPTNSVSEFTFTPEQQAAIDKLNTLGGITLTSTAANIAINGRRDVDDAEFVSLLTSLTPLLRGRNLRINLSMTSIGNASLLALRGLELHTVDVSDTKVNADAIADQLKQMDGFDWRFSTEITDQGLATLLQGQRLRRLQIANNISGDVLRQIGNTEIEQLVITGTIDQRQIKAIAELQSLKQLRLLLAPGVSEADFQLLAQALPKTEIVGTGNIGDLEFHAVPTANDSDQ